MELSPPEVSIHGSLYEVSVPCKPPPNSRKLRSRRMAARSARYFARLKNSVSTGVDLISLRNATASSRASTASTVICAAAGHTEAANAAASK